MSLDVRKEDADALASWVKTLLDRVSPALERVASAGRAMGELDGFAGSAADASRAYWEEVHVPILIAVDAAACELFTRYAEYLSALDGIDPSREARFGFDALSTAERDFGPLSSDASERSVSLAGVLGGIGDLVELSAPSEADLVDNLFDLADSPRAHREAVQAVEDFYSRSAASLDPLIAELVQAIGFAGSIGTFEAYAPGSAQGQAWLEGLAGAVAVSGAYSAGRFESAFGSYANALERVRVRRQLEERKDHGTAEMLLGGTAVLIGGVAIFVSGGAAAPFVAPMMMFGSAQYVEGMQDTWYGKHGNLESAAWNPIRDTIFFGNQDVYNIGYGAADLVATWGVPFSSAISAAETAGVSVFGSIPAFAKSFAKDAAKEVAYDASIDAVFGVVVDPQIDKGFGGTETKEALKSIGRDLTGEAASGIGDKLVDHFKAGGSESIKTPKGEPPLKDGPYMKDGRPNGRPRLSGKRKLEFEQAVYDRQVSADGILRDPNTGEAINWKPGEPRRGVCDFGHAEVRYSELFEQYRTRKITLQQLKDYEFDPSHFQIETPAANRSHVYE